MSGGSLDYCCFKVSDAADSIKGRARNPLERAFASHLYRVSAALRSLEWVYSGDGDADCEKNIRAVVSRSDELREAIATAERARLDLESALLFAKAQETTK